MESNGYEKMRCLLCGLKSETEVEMQTWGDTTAPLCKDDSACYARIRERERKIKGGENNATRD